MAEKIKVLIVDDEEIVVRGIKKGLEQENMQVETILGGKGAIETLSKEFYDVVIVDLVMPGMNGVETCREIKRISPKTKVLLLSGFPNEIEHHHMNFINAGGDDLFLRKPLLAGEVAEAIRKIVV